MTEISVIIVRNSNFYITIFSKDFKQDYAFLKKIQSRNKTWKDMQHKARPNKSKLPANFLMHPKQLTSDSECSSWVQSPRKFFSSTIIKSSDLEQEGENNVSCVL